MSDLTGHRTRSDATGTEEGVACAGVFSRRPGWRLILKPPTKGVRPDAVNIYKQRKTQNRRVTRWLVARQRDHVLPALESPKSPRGPVSAPPCP